MPVAAPPVSGSAAPFLRGPLCHAPGPPGLFSSLTKEPAFSAENDSFVPFSISSSPLTAGYNERKGPLSLPLSLPQNRPQSGLGGAHMSPRGAERARQRLAQRPGTKLRWAPERAHGGRDAGRQQTHKIHTWGSDLTAQSQYACSLLVSILIDPRSLQYTIHFLKKDAHVPTSGQFRPPRCGGLQGRGAGNPRHCGP